MWFEKFHLVIFLPPPPLDLRLLLPLRCSTEPEFGPRNVCGVPRPEVAEEAQLLVIYTNKVRLCVCDKAS